jgi:hypothetical protein
LWEQNYNQCENTSTASVNTHLQPVSKHNTASAKHKYSQCETQFLFNYNNNNRNSKREEYTQSFLLHLYLRFPFLWRGGVTSAYPSHTGTQRPLHLPVSRSPLPGCLRLCLCLFAGITAHARSISTVFCGLE